DLEQGTETTYQLTPDSIFDSMVWVGGGVALLERFQKPKIWTAAGMQREIDCDWAGSLAGSPNGRYVGAYQSGRVALFEVKTGKRAFEDHEPLHHKGGALVIGANGLLITTGGGLVGRWESALPTG
ncbi:MAG: hypothetical protein AB7S68_39480, partial [Polyangiaceae bacterium]